MATSSGAAAIGQSAAATVRTGALALALLSFGHFFIDLYSAALSALQPRLATHLGLSLTQAGILGGLMVFASSVLQPLYGILSDRFHTRMFTVLSPAVAGVFISSLGLAPSYGWLLALVFLGGSGVAAFHPQASARVTMGVAESRARWMAVFISTGTLGMAIGPAFFSLVPNWLGFERTHWAAVPGILCSALLWAYLPEVPRPEKRIRFELAPLRAVQRPLTILYFCVFIRSIVQVTFTQLLPLYLSREQHLPVAQANYVLSLYLAFGAIGGIVGGSLADRIGGRRVIMLSFVFSVPFLVLFFTASGWLSFAGLWIGGLILLFTIPVNVVMAQELAPTQASTVSALMMGFSWGMSGLIFVPLTGWLSESLSMRLVMLGLSTLPLAGFFLARMLPEPRRA
ncbi:MAG: MFS transporter [Acidobacteria bacterium]|nr:MFS transporter [Acidobacteriota bacterium]